jgi:toxin ParE1/3/4
MRVIWSETAEREIADLYDYVTTTSSPEAATRAVDRILSRGDQIAAFPESGREVEDFASPSIREVMEGPYRIVYEIRRDEDRIDVLAVFHGRRLPPWLRDE